MKYNSDYSIEAHQLAKNNNLEITYTDKYAKGCKAKGPRNWGKVNLDNAKAAIERKASTVNFWRG